MCDYIDRAYFKAQLKSNYPSNMTWLSSFLRLKAHDSYTQCLAFYGEVNNTKLPAGVTLKKQCHNLEHWLSKVNHGT